MPKDKKNGGFVTKDLCDERSQRIADKIDDMDKRVQEKLVVIDDKVEEIRTNHKEQGHALRNMLLTIIGGVVVSIVTFYLSRVPQ